MLYIPRQGLEWSDDNIGSTSAEYGTSVASHATTAHTKNATYTELVASTSSNAYGIWVQVSNTAVASTRTSVLVDIAVGAASSETVIIPNLIAGNQAASSTTSLGGSSYYFPIFIPAGSRISATAQSVIVADTVTVAVVLLGYAVPGMWYGSRVTAYGVDTSASTGTLIAPGNTVYSAVSLTTNSNPVKYLQVGTDLYTLATGATARGLIRVSGEYVYARDLPYYESTTLESTYFTPANLILSQMRFSIPAGSTLNVHAMRNVASANRGFALYGVD